MKLLSSPEKRVRFFLILFMIALTLSGLTAIPTQWETQVLEHFFGTGTRFSQFLPALSIWVDRIDEAVQSSYTQYPFLTYPNDWLAFGHVVIAIAFIGPLRDPLKNIWVIEFGTIACLLVIPWAILFGFVRGIPLFWTLIDTSFGIIGIVPLWFVRHEILLMKSS